MFCEGALPLFHIPVWLKDAPPQRIQAFFPSIFGVYYLKLVWHFILSTKWKQRNAYRILGGRALTTSGENAELKKPLDLHPWGHWLVNKKKKRLIISFPSRWIDLISKKRNGGDAFHIGMCVVIWHGYLLQNDASKWADLSQRCHINFHFVYRFLYKSLASH